MERAGAPPRRGPNGEGLKRGAALLSGSSLSADGWDKQTPARTHLYTHAYTSRKKRLKECYQVVARAFKQTTQHLSCPFVTTPTFFFFHLFFFPLFFIFSIIRSYSITTCFKTFLTLVFWLIFIYHWNYQSIISFIHFGKFQTRGRVGVSS